jgi:hypothetical protein
MKVCAVIALFFLGCNGYVMTTTSTGRERVVFPVKGYNDEIPAFSTRSVSLSGRWQDSMRLDASVEEGSVEEGVSSSGIRATGGEDDSQGVFEVRVLALGRRWWEMEMTPCTPPNHTPTHTHTHPRLPLR